jgi:hypothetical protein
MSVELMGAIGFLVMIGGALFGQYKWWGGSIGKVRDDLAAHKLHVAETYVSKQGHREATEQIMDAIGAVKTSIDGTNQRIDRILENGSRPTRRAG